MVMRSLRFGPFEYFGSQMNSNFHVMVECSQQRMKNLYRHHFMVWNWLVCQPFACGIIITTFCNAPILSSNLLKQRVQVGNCSGDFKPSFYYGWVMTGISGVVAQVTVCSTKTQVQISSFHVHHVRSNINF